MESLPLVPKLPDHVFWGEVKINLGDSQMVVSQDVLQGESWLKRGIAAV